MGNKTSNYLLSMDPKPTDRKSENVVGKLRANWVRAADDFYVYSTHALSGSPDLATPFTMQASTRRKL